MTLLLPWVQVKIYISNYIELLIIVWGAGGEQPKGKARVLIVFGGEIRKIPILHTAKIHFYMTVR